MKLRVIACGVFEPYINLIASETPNEIDSRILDAGLHERPNDLRLELQSEIDEASRKGRYDAVVLLYGLCGRGIANLAARDIPVVIPRAHDCITLFLGSSEAYLKQFNKNPGTFYHTLGWLEKKINPKNRDASRLYKNFTKDGYDKHPDFIKYKKEYGEDNAGHIVAFLDRWKQNYSRAAYIDMGFPGEEDVAGFTREMAEIFSWEHEVIAGDPSLIRNILTGNWSDSRVLVLEPGQRSISTGDDKIIASIPIDLSEPSDTPAGSEVIIESGDGAGESAGIGLGIDAGGTYTDVVIYDIGRKKLLAKSKALTTYQDLLIGIRNALSRLPHEMLSLVEVTSLSTTLATNSIVEGRGHKVGLIAVSPWDWTEEQIGHSPLVNVPGGVSITGEIVNPLDEDACREAAEKLIKNDSCAAIVVAGYATLRNPEQANRIREIILENYDVPVICSHEVSRRINGVHAAQTAIANAKLLPVIRRLIDSVHQALEDFNVSGKLMVVKGDGSPVDESIARARPVETILSGPAASVSGARILTGLSDALILDIGGTTTDCAILQDGQVVVAPEGARIGSWVMSVDAVEISTVGLGGDSRIDFTVDRKITVGPQRSIPLSYLAAEYKNVLDYLTNLDELRFANAQNASAMDILVRGLDAGIDLAQKEMDLLDLLEDGPVPITKAAEMLGLPSPVLLPLSRLESCGAIKRAALTPTDLLHITGVFDKWSRDAAVKALKIFAAMYGRPADEVLLAARTAVTRRLFEEIIRREVTHENRSIADLPADWGFLLDKAFDGDGVGLGVRMSLSRPVVAIGAPAEALVPEVGKHLQAEVVVPEDADVANAIGAIGSEVVVREEIIIRPGDTSNYVLHGTDERIEFTELNRATEKAIEIARKRAKVRAVKAGAISPGVTVSRFDNTGSVSDGGRIFLERKVIAVASGGAFARAVKFS